MLNFIYFIGVTWPPPPTTLKVAPPLPASTWFSALYLFHEGHITMDTLSKRKKLSDSVWAEPNSSPKKNQSKESQWHFNAHRNMTNVQKRKLKSLLTQKKFHNCSDSCISLNIYIRNNLWLVSHFWLTRLLGYIQFNYTTLQLFTIKISWDGLSICAGKNAAIAGVHTSFRVSVVSSNCM